MGYVATKGGTEAVLYTEQLIEYLRLRGGSDPISVGQIQDQMRLAVDRVMTEGSLYAPELAALALKQSEGDTLEASFLLRAYRSTVPRLAYSLPAHGDTMRLLRRISSTFKDIPGGQLLGPTRDYQLKLLNTLLLNESTDSLRQFLTDFERAMDVDAADDQPGRLPKVVRSLRTQGLLADAGEPDEAEAYDVTRKAIVYPAPRSARLQILTRGNEGSILSFAYSSVRGYGDVHPTLGELRVGYLPVEVAHPLTGEAVEIGEILATECEMVSRAPDSTGGQPKFGLGYGFSFGHGEIKAISMGILDRVLSAAKTSGTQPGPASNEEFVLEHVDGIEASGFTAHFKLPHYVTFQADISALDRARDHSAAQISAEAERRHALMHELGEPHDHDGGMISLHSHAPQPPHGED